MDTATEQQTVVTTGAPRAHFTAAKNPTGCCHVRWVGPMDGPDRIPTEHWWALRGLWSLAVRQMADRIEGVRYTAHDLKNGLAGGLFFSDEDLSYSDVLAAVDAELRGDFPHTRLAWTWEARERELRALALWLRERMAAQS